MRSLRQGAHYTTIKMNTALRRSINLTSIGSNFCEGGEEILKERSWRSHSSKESWNQKPDGKGNCMGRTSPRSQARKHEQVPSIRRTWEDRFLSVVPRRRSALLIGGKQRESSEEGEEGVGRCPIRFGAGSGGKGINRARGERNDTYLGGVDRWSRWPMA